MRRMDGTRAARSRTALSGALMTLLAGLVVAAPVTGASDEPTAVATKKKKCKKPLWKCAPKRYHLSATDNVGPGPQSAGLEEHWTAEVDLVRIARSIGTVVYGSAGGKVNVSGSFATECADGSPGTVRIEPQTIAVPPGPGYPFVGDFGVEFSLIGSDKNTYGGPLGTQGSGHSSLYVTAISPCPEVGTFQTELTTPLAGMEGRGKPGRVLRGSGVDSRLFQHHSFSWRLTPGGGKKK
jgi:hypothetical protein